MSNETRARLKLVVEVEYELNGTEVIALKDNIEDIITSSLGEGRFTGSSEAEIDGYTITITDEPVQKNLRQHKSSVNNL